MGCESGRNLDDPATQVLLNQFGRWWLISPLTAVFQIWDFWLKPENISLLENL
jgi:hypothetical protein